jgi:NAD(P)-dependent dehydrogenase (short-subunit alcohol dehydrogenase family)
VGSDRHIGRVKGDYIGRIYHDSCDTVDVVSTPDQFRALFDLTGRSALVVGGGSGIGEAAARGLAAFGARVTVADARHAAAMTVAEQIGGDAVGVALDLLDGAAIDGLARSIDTPDILVATPSVNVRKAIIDYSDDELDQVIDLNIKGTFRLVRAFGRSMATAGRGSIIGFSSVRSQTTEPGQGAYAATKAATVMLFKTLAAELGPSGVRANVIAPGVVETPLTTPIRSSPEWYQAYADKAILQRWAQPEEMVGAVIYLASDASSYVTGSTLFVDGGWTAADGRFVPPT